MLNPDLILEVYMNLSLIPTQFYNYKYVNITHSKKMKLDLKLHNDSLLDKVIKYFKSDDGIYFESPVEITFRNIKIIGNFYKGVHVDLLITGLDQNQINLVKQMEKKMTSMLKRKVRMLDRDNFICDFYKRKIGREYNSCVVKLTHLNLVWGHYYQINGEIIKTFHAI